MSRRRSRESRRRDPPGVIAPEMNVTPLVDVVLVLLIIFMVVAPRMDQDLPVDLPSVFNADPEIGGQLDPIKVTIPRVGEFHLEQRQHDLDGLVAALTEQHAREPLRRLVLRADGELTYGDLRPLLERTRAIGFPGFSFLVGEKHRAAPVVESSWP